jgi:PAS domain S-box-containing protein
VDERTSVSGRGVQPGIAAEPASTPPEPQAAAAEANAKFRAFFEQETHFAGVLTVDGTVTEANRLCVDFCGYERREVIGRPFWDCGWWNRSPALVAMIREGIAQAAAGRLFRRETPYFLADGSERVVDLVLAPVTDDHGRILFVAATGTDIVDRKRVELRLRRGEESQRLLVAINDVTRQLKAPQAVMAQIVARVGQHLRVGRCAYGEVDETQQYFRVDSDYTDGVVTVAGRHRLESFGPELIRDLKGGRTVIIPDLALDPRTRDAPSLAAYAAIDTRAALCVPLVKEGRFVALLALHHPEPRPWTLDEIGLLEQVAQRTWFAVEHARAEASARETGDVLSLAMRGGRMGYWSRDLKTDEVWWSRELEELFGLAPGGFAGTQDGFLSFVHHDDRPVLRESVDAALASGSDYTVEFRFTTAAGEWRWMEGRGRAVYAEDGRPKTLYGLGIDITARKEAEKALASARDAAESANRLKDQFLATLSHELRTPLNAILGYARMLRSDMVPPDKRQHALEVIERNAFAQTQLVEDLLDISRITTGKVRIRPEPIAAAAALGEALESVRLAAETKRITLQIEIDPLAGIIHADPARLQQVFWNLLSNAVKFTGNGGRIVVRLEWRQDSVRISVSDSGMGIAPEFLPYVFEPFHQADGRFSREYGGLGLGLAICKQLIELHGGTIRATSDGAGRGAAFVVNLPRREVAPHGGDGESGRTSATSAAGTE